jgi:hypothetical protein
MLWQALGKFGLVFIYQDTKNISTQRNKATKNTKDEIGDERFEMKTATDCTDDTDSICEIRVIRGFS